MSSTTLLATDNQRSVVNTLEANDAPQLIAYSPYGHHPAACRPLSLLGFNGELAEPMTGHYLLGNGYRAFNPILMRFNSPDRLSPFGKGGLNYYTYCSGDPINFSDPNGAFSLPKSLSNALTRTLKAFGLPGKTHISGPEKIFKQKTTTTIVKRTKIGNNWSEVKELITQNETTTVSRVSVEDGVILKISQGQPSYLGKFQPTLFELSYRKIPGNTLDKLYKQYNFPTADPRIDSQNYSNSKSIMVHNAPASKTSTYQALDLLHQEHFYSTLRGEVNGVRPSLIRKQ